MKPFEKLGASAACTQADDRLRWERAHVAIFAHDLKNLLNALAVNTEVLLRQNGAGIAASATNIRLAIGRMDQLVSGLFDLAKLDAGRLNVAPQPQDTAELIREAVDIFQPFANSRSVSLNVSIADVPLRAQIDNDRVFQVLSNLLVNAIQFSPTNGRVSVSAAKVGEVVRVAVEGSGPGIEKCELEHVFDRYRQLHSPNGKGLGLGLFISKSIVQAHGGQIWAESRPGAGSTFFFTVPGIDDASRRERPHASPDAVSH